MFKIRLYIFFLTRSVQQPCCGVIRSGKLVQRLHTMYQWSKFLRLLRRYSTLRTRNRMCCWPHVSRKLPWWWRVKESRAYRWRSFSFMDSSWIISAEIQLSYIDYFIYLKGVYMYILKIIYIIKISFKRHFFSA